MKLKNLYNFAIESNEIENIHSIVKHDIHHAALKTFLQHKTIDIEALRRFVAIIQPSATYRSESLVEVTINGCDALASDAVSSQLIRLLSEINTNSFSPDALHYDYEHLHPFSDGNGRSGRALWLWQKVKFYGYTGNNLFLKEYYYETLS